MYNIVSYRNIPILYIKIRAEAGKRENERLSMERCYCVALSSCVGQRSLGRELMGVGSRGRFIFVLGTSRETGSNIVAIGIRQCRQRTPEMSPLTTHRHRDENRRVTLAMRQNRATNETSLKRTSSPSTTIRDTAHSELWITTSDGNLAK